MISFLDIAEFKHINVQCTSFIEQYTANSSLLGPCLPSTLFNRQNEKSSGSCISFVASMDGKASDFFFGVYGTTLERD